MFAPRQRNPPPAERFALCEKTKDFDVMLAHVRGGGWFEVNRESSTYRMNPDTGAFEEKRFEFLSEWQPAKYVPVGEEWTLFGAPRFSSATLAQCVDYAVKHRDMDLDETSFMRDGRPGSRIVGKGLTLVDVHSDPFNDWILWRDGAWDDITQNGARDMEGK